MPKDRGPTNPKLANHFGSTSTPIRTGEAIRRFAAGLLQPRENRHAAPALPSVDRAVVKPGHRRAADWANVAKRHPESVRVRWKGQRLHLPLRPAPSTRKPPKRVYAAGMLADRSPLVLGRPHNFLVLVPVVDPLDDRR